MEAEEKHGFEGEGFVYLKSPVWWAGITTREFYPSNRKSGAGRYDVRLAREGED